jgi:hypothetical protein
MDEKNEYVTDKSKINKLGCIKKTLLIGTVIAGFYLINNYFSKENDNNYMVNDKKTEKINNLLSALDKENRSQIISQYINKDSIDLKIMANTLNNDKTFEFLDYVNNGNNLNQEQKSEYILNMYSTLDKKNKFNVVKDMAKSSIGF